MRYQRKELSEKLSNLQGEVFDIIIIGGGATGLGCALDATLRGFSTLLLEKDDFASGTSGSSTKLIHGGVRYLQQFDFPLITEALHERSHLLRNAPDIVHPLQFVIPAYSVFEKMYYQVGLKMYDLLAGRGRIQFSKSISKPFLENHFPNIQSRDLKGGVAYYDAQFDDALLAISMAGSINRNGGYCANYCKVESFLKNPNEKIEGVNVYDQIGDQHLTFKSAVVINASGIFCNEILEMDNNRTAERIMTSRGSHIVVTNEKINSKSAILVPKTKDGRVIFAVPWYDRVVIGTTDIVDHRITNRPEITKMEVDFLLETINPYLNSTLNYKDIRATFCGIRPLIKPQQHESSKDLSRKHNIEISDSGLLSIMGGKWTTYRAMAEDAVDAAIELGSFSKVPSSTLDHFIENRSKDLELWDNDEVNGDFLKEMIENQMATSLADILARRTRHCLLDINRSKEIARSISEYCEKNNIAIDHDLESFDIFNSTYYFSSSMFDSVSNATMEV